MEHGISLFPELVTWLFTSYREQFSGGTVFCLQNRPYCCAEISVHALLVPTGGSRISLQAG